MIEQPRLRLQIRERCACLTSNNDGPGQGPMKAISALARSNVPSSHSSESLANPATSKGCRQTGSPLSRDDAPSARESQRCVILSAARGTEFQDQIRILWCVAARISRERALDETL